MYSAVRPRFKKLFLWAAPLAALACGGEGGTDIVLPSLRVTTVTTGVELDQDGYGVAIDGGSAQSIALDGTLTVDRLTEGTHTIVLSDLAANCAAQGDNPRQVSVSAGVTASAAFAIVCSPSAALPGTLQVATTTTGPGTDPDGFALLLDGGDGGPIGVSAVSSLTEVAAGSHSIGLTGLAANCQVSGENPRTLDVPAGGTAQVAFQVTCAALSPATGTLRAITTTGGAGIDPDGYALLLDGVERGLLGVNATVSLIGVAAGSHTVGLTGLAANCRVSGENPRAVPVPAGGTAEISFAVTCTAAGPTTGSLSIATVTTGPAQDADGYQVSVDGAASQPIGVTATLRLANLSVAQHSVRLAGLASNCSVTGANPIGVAVGAGETAQVSFAITCVATVGSLTITVSGLPAGAAAGVTVSGPANFSQAVTETRTLNALVPGNYAVRAGDVTSGGTTYRASVGQPSVPVAAGVTASVTVSYTPVARTPTLNLRIDGLYLTQSTQTPASTVPLVANRAAFLRVFVVANESNTAQPRVRVQFFRDGTLTTSRTIAASQGSVPIRVDEAELLLGRSWNVPVEASLIQPGLAIVAEVDDGNTIEESSETDNRFPGSGSKSFVVQPVSGAAIRFVRVFQAANGLEGSVGNTSELLDLSRRMYPLNSVQADVRASVLTVNGPLLPRDENSWGQVLSDLDGARTADPDGSAWTYYGVVKLNYGRQEGIVGQAFQETGLAIGWDDPSDAGRVVAHELGHTWGRRHSPCGGPPSASVDPLYPYAGGRIGVYGMDVARTDLKPPSTADIMGYCFSEPWISDYTYRNVMAFRAAHFPTAGAQAIPQRSLLVWGRLVNGRPVLEPAFEVVTRPSLPKQPGPYTITATGADGARLIRLSFDIASAQDESPGNGHFAFAVPLNQVDATRLASLRLEGPTGGTPETPARPELPGRAGTTSIVARRVGPNVSLQWDAIAFPMIMVRNPDTGEVLSFARGGDALVRTAKAALDLDISDGVRSQRRRVAINRS